MKKIAILLLFFSMSCNSPENVDSPENTENVGSITNDNCHSTSLFQIQKIAEASLLDREAVASSTGFSFGKEYEIDGVIMRSFYTECNNTKYYEELTIARPEFDFPVFIYSTHDAENFLLMKNQIKKLSCDYVEDSHTGEEYYNSCSDGNSYRFFNISYANASVYNMGIMQTIRVMQHDNQ